MDWKETENGNEIESEEETRADDENAAVEELETLETSEYDLEIDEPKAEAEDEENIETKKAKSRRRKVFKAEDEAEKLSSNPDILAIKARKSSRRKTPYGEYFIAGIVVIGLLGGVVFGGTKLYRHFKGGNDPAVSATQKGDEQERSMQEESTLSEEELKALAESESAALEASIAESESAAHEAAVSEAISNYQNLGIVKVSGYLNIRKSPEAGANIVGKLLGDSACDITESLEGWYKITSGGIEGYISSQYVLTGEEAKKEAGVLAKDQAVVTADNLNIRKEPSMDAEVVGQCLVNERYEILGEADGWFQIPSGYISADYAEKRFCLNEARKLDLKAMVLNYYDKPGVSNVSGYLNIRDGASKDAEIIGKLPSYAGCEILEELEGWYKIRSGKITGYVSSEYILTGDVARDAAMEHASLMAVVSTDKLNARTEPSTDAKIWTQISSNERYHVASQEDGWVQIEFDEEGDDGEVVRAYVSSEFVDVRYALNEAMKFSPAEINATKRSQIVNYGLQFLGNRYVWGGNSLTNGVDCSGFTQQVLKKFGISIPRVSRDQAKSGVGINSSQMRPGDLVFYGNSRGTINHVAMYIGNGQVVHAASRKSGIKISAWNYRTPLKIRDVIGDQ